jgi:hypothetical protein
MKTTLLILCIAVWASAGIKADTVALIKVDTMVSIKCDTTRVIKRDTVRIIKMVKDSSWIVKSDTLKPKKK